MVVVGMISAPKGRLVGCPMTEQGKNEERGWEERVLSWDWGPLAAMMMMMENQQSVRFN
jgi:hypothetical protein